MDLRACMDYFDVKGDGVNIDYHAYLTLCRYRDPELSPAVQRLRTSMLASPQLFSALKEADKNGHGFLSRADMTRVMGQLGYENLSQVTLLGMIRFFETKLEGQVNYMNFLQYIHENSESQSLLHVEAKLRGFGVSGDVLDEGTIRALFARIDSKGQGAFSLSDLSNFVSETIDENASKAVKLALFAEFASKSSLSQNGVDFGLFLSWFQTIPSVRAEMTAAFSQMILSPNELKMKANSYLKECSSSLTPSIEAVRQSYRVYDWRRSSTGVVDLPCFVKASKRVGLPFTVQEIRSLAVQFRYSTSDPNLQAVDYKAFLEWGYPDLNPNPNPNPNPRSSNRESVSSSHPHNNPNPNPNPNRNSHNAGSILRLLEKALLRGVDLLSTFGRYDSLNVGRVTALEFCAALTDLGLSGVSPREALEIADRFKAAAGQVVLYRRIVSELIRQADEETPFDAGPKGKGGKSVDIMEILLQLIQSSG